MAIGKQMQFFGARLNAAKTLLYAINGGRDEMSGKLIVPDFTGIDGDAPLDFDTVWAKYDDMLTWAVETYVEALNIIHYSHDKYAYEAMEMALHDDEIVRTMGCGIAGLSIVADLLAAIKYATVTPIRDDSGLSSTTSPRASSRGTATTTTAPTSWPPLVVKTVMDKDPVAEALPTPCRHSRCSPSPSNVRSTARRSGRSRAVTGRHAACAGRQPRERRRQPRG
ncbi:MAG: pyruvate formate lyase family protein [Micropruina glycogenica]